MKISTENLRNCLQVPALCNNFRKGRKYVSKTLKKAVIEFDDYFKSLGIINLDNF